MIKVGDWFSYSGNIVSGDIFKVVRKVPGFYYQWVCEVYNNEYEMLNDNRPFTEEFLLDNCTRLTKTIQEDNLNGQNYMFSQGKNQLTEEQCKESIKKAQTSEGTLKIWNEGKGDWDLVPFESRMQWPDNEPVKPYNEVEENLLEDGKELMKELKLEGGSSANQYRKSVLLPLTKDRSQYVEVDLEVEDITTAFNFSANAKDATKGWFRKGTKNEDLYELNKSLWFTLLEKCAQGYITKAEMWEQRKALGLCDD